ncbi:MAG: prepilin peptidase [Candidatus Moranbacteria bacterium]|nr:prepilin peptidase [Candidatus Moranbacteria bacterium]
MSLFFLVLGLSIGSFINVLVYRLRVAESIMGRSFCPHCRNKVAWYDNIPLVSFVLLRFRCRNCKERISWQYPLVEALTGIIFLAIGSKFFSFDDMYSWFLTGYYFFISASLISIVAYDMLYMEIPSIVLWVATAFALAFNFLFDIEKGQLLSFANGLTLSGLAASAAAFAFFFSLSKFSKEKWMGMGDAYLVILLGFIVGWPEILFALFSAFSIGAICGIILILFKKKKMESQLPFAPFLVLGTLLTLFFYQAVMDWYLGLFNL